MSPRNDDGFLDHRRGFRCKAIAREIGGIGELRGRDIRPVVQRAAHGPAEIVDQDVVIADVALGIEQNAIEDVDDECDEREPCPDAGSERRKEEKAESSSLPHEPDASPPAAPCHGPNRNSAIGDR